MTVYKHVSVGRQKHLFTKTFLRVCVQTMAYIHVFKVGRYVQQSNRLIMIAVVAEILIKLHVS